MAPKKNEISDKESVNADLESQLSDQQFDELVDSYKSVHQKMSENKKWELKVKFMGQQVHSKYLLSESSVQVEPESVLSDVSSVKSLRNKNRESTQFSRQSDVGFQLLERGKIIELIESWNDDNDEMIILELEKHKEYLKLGLMMPLEDYAKSSSKSKITWKLYEEYGPTEELYALTFWFNKSLAIFEYLWDKVGTMWSDYHLVPCINELIRSKWNEGLDEFFTFERTISLYKLMNPKERREFYTSLDNICQHLSETKDDDDEEMLNTILHNLWSEPYVTLSFIYLFEHFHNQEFEINADLINPYEWNDDIIYLWDDKDFIVQLAERFDEACNSDIDEKEIYRIMLIKYLEFSYYGEPSNVEVEQIWESIYTDDNFKFRAYLTNKKIMWLNLGIRKSLRTQAFNEAIRDNRVKKLSLKLWKPAHLWWYLDREIQIDDIIKCKYLYLRFLFCLAIFRNWLILSLATGGYFAKAILTESSKLKCPDMFMPLNILIRTQNATIFAKFWKISNMWTQTHLFQWLALLNTDNGFFEPIYTIIINSKTTKQILSQSEDEISEELKSLMAEIKQRGINSSRK